MNRQFIINELKNGNQQLLIKIYIKYQDQFLAYGFKRYPIDYDDLKEIYRDVVLAFYQFILNGKLTNLTTSLKSYLFEIGKYKIYKYFSNQNFEIEYSGITDDWFSFISSENEYSEPANRDELIKLFEEAEKSSKTEKVHKFRFYYRITAIILIIIIAAGIVLTLTHRYQSLNRLANEMSISKNKNTYSHPADSMHLRRSFWKIHFKNNNKYICLSLFNKYFEAYPDETDRNLKNEDSFFFAMDKYNQKKFYDALDLFNRILKFHYSTRRISDIQFYSAICNIELGKYKKAHNNLSVIADNYNHYQSQAKWYLALLYLKKNRKAEAKILLNKIISEKGYNYGKAVNLINEIPD